MGIRLTECRFPDNSELKQLLDVSDDEELTILNLHKYLRSHMIDVEPPQPRNDEDG